MTGRYGARWILAALTALTLSGCGAHKAAEDDKAPPPSKNAGKPEANAPVSLATPPPAAPGAQTK